jgi:PadR family transcriptional regulator, regulatory protein PadR
MTASGAPDRQLMRGAATTLILVILGEQPSYGYQIVQEISRRSKQLLEFGEGTIYPLLYSLESSGIVKGVWGQGSGERKRRVYELTPKGKKELKRRLASWERYEAGMRAALRNT